VAVALAALAVGCSRPGGVDRLPVYGTVAHPSGEKINGSISFVPDRGRTGPSAVTSLVNGEYRFDQTNGPTKGLSRVIVMRTVPKEPVPKQLPGRKGRLAGAKRTTAPPPAAEWTLSADVPAGGPYKIDFQLP
jgi:hypothetical protein